MAGLRRADGTAYVAEARLDDTPPGAQVADRVYRWDDPGQSPCRGEGGRSQRGGEGDVSGEV